MSPFPQGTDPAPHLRPVPHGASLCPSANTCPCPEVSLRLQGTLEALMHEGPGTVGGNCCLRSVLPPNHPACSCCLKQWSGIKHFNVYLRSSLPGNQDSVRLESGQWVQTDWSLKPDSPVQKPSILKKVLTFFELQHLHLWNRNRTTPGGSDSKESACNVGDLGSILGSGGSPGGGNGNPLLPWEIPWTEDRLQSIGSQKSQMWLSDWAHSTWPGTV